ncbi:response regulator transcription factor [Petroclostridium sp. X23]|uniref:response regulator transcription factor n=1 Tax=Petroclostridium sp. X23 TaxID=3045146 RepID=UPI0024ADF31F|nr:response regulator transcription factor [Petroclostridium sp. X23]WHH60270.1 response regulator transcription factor [Petroclostridium sp. X23]
MPIKILIVEDEPKLRKLMRDYFSKEGFSSIESDNGKDALEKFENLQPDIIILDIMLPELDGWTVMKRIRDTSNIPVIMLTARSEEEDKLFGYELGADDYITKPFSLKVLIAKVKALLKRSGKIKIEENAISIDALKLDLASHRALLNGKDLELSPKEYDLLSLLIQNKETAFSRDELLNKVWGYDYFGDARTVDTTVKRLRSKLEDYSHMIETVRGYGYRLSNRKKD